MEQKFDSKGLLHTITEIGKAYQVPLPPEIEKLGFCMFCLGAHVPLEENLPERAWRCGAWVDGMLPPLKICGHFQVNKKALHNFTERIRPDGTERMAVYETK